jgi:NAD(P)-dependent dehydrogenase (short-subunit alcohol dehydrogenase family)
MDFRDANHEELRHSCVFSTERGLAMTQPVVFVVGAGGELGRATAATLAASGSTVVGIDRDQRALAELPEGVQPEVADPTDPAAVPPLIERLVHQVGVPDALVNTVGAFGQGDVLNTTPDLLLTMIDVNLGPAVWLSQAVAPHMKRRGSGSIVHISSRPGLEPSPGMAAYAASKAALVHLIRILDLELRPDGIRVNSIAPQLLDTARNRAGLPAEMLAGAVAPEAIAKIVQFLISDAAAPISGAIVPAYG